MQSEKLLANGVRQHQGHDPVLLQISLADLARSAAAIIGRAGIAPVQKDRSQRTAIYDRSAARAGRDGERGDREDVARNETCEGKALAQRPGRARRGLIEWSSSGVPRKKIYLDQMPGQKVQDIWEFKDPQHPNYPTEKNLDMLKLIVAASSDEQDLVLDCFCGSGTTLVAADELNRNWIGIDESEHAIEVAKRRLDAAAGQRGGRAVYEAVRHSGVEPKRKQVSDDYALGRYEQTPQREPLSLW